MADLLWPLVTLAIAGIACFAFCRWLTRETTTVRELKANIAELEQHWNTRFGTYERAHDALVTRFNSASPSPNPLGKTYSTQRPG